MIEVLLSFTNAARRGMEKTGASEETIQAVVEQAERVRKGHSRRPEEVVIQIEWQDLYVVFNETMRTVVKVDWNANYRPNNPGRIEWGCHSGDRAILRDLYLGIPRRLPSSLSRAERGEAAAAYSAWERSRSVTGDASSDGKGRASSALWHKIYEILDV